MAVTVGKAVTAEAGSPKRMSLLFILTGLFSLAGGVFLGPLQALNYAGIDLYHLPLPFLNSYYQGLSLHGVLMAIVFPSFFISGFLLYLPARELRLPPNLTWSWAAYWLMIGGLALAAIALLGNHATVLFTFYPPLQANWAFYLGAGLIVIGTLVIAGVVLELWLRWRRANPGQITPLVTYMSLTTWLMWVIATPGLVVLVVVLLLPWSLGLLPGVDPALSRTLFWFTGHPLVYFWLLPAYVVWYTIVPKIAGGKLISDPLARLAFLLFLLFSVPVGFHHQFADPSIPAAWKMVHTVLTLFVAVPSLLTAFSVAASLELAGRMRGGKGILGWITALPWRDAAFVAPALAMISFIFGGAGGIVNASFNLNAIIHNTAWVPGHFHLTVGTAVTLTFMGAVFWLIPHLTQRSLVAPGLARLSAWLWFAGMMVFAFGMHWLGLLGVPRRSHVAVLGDNLEQTYVGTGVPASITGLGGAILFVAGILFFYVLIATLVSGRRLMRQETPEIPFAEVVSGPGNKPVVKLMDRIGLWLLIAGALILVAYVPTLIDQIRNYVPVPGMRLW